MNVHLARKALGGDIAGSHKVLCPGPGHSLKDRSLAVTIDIAAPDGFLVHSFAGDDWFVCRDYVRSRLGLPAWEPGDERDRRIRPDRVKAWDRAAIDREADQDFYLWTPEQRRRIRSAELVWDEAVDPCGTLAETYLREQRRLDLPDDLTGHVLRYHAGCPWRE